MTNRDPDAVSRVITAYITEHFLVDFGDRVTASTDLFQGGLIDSFGFMQLISFIEAEFKIEYSVDELTSAHLNHLDGLIASVNGKLASQASPSSSGEDAGA